MSGVRSPYRKEATDQRVLRSLKRSPGTVDQLRSRLGLQASTVIGYLCKLRKRGKVKKLGHIWEIANGQIYPVSLKDIVPTGLHSRVWRTTNEVWRYMEKKRAYSTHSVGVVLRQLCKAGKIERTERFVPGYSFHRKVPYWRLKNGKKTSC